MKTKIMFVLFFTITSSTLLFSQNGSVGINTPNPTRTFDVNGDVRIRIIRDTTNVLKYLAVDDSGNIYKTFAIPNNSILDTCPPGFISVNDEYCIEQDERPATIWWDAIQICGNLNAHLCDWYEWYFAALNTTSLGLLNITGNREWVAEGGSGVVMKYVGPNTITESGTTNNALDLYEFRCCKSK